MCKPCNVQFTNRGAGRSPDRRQLCALCRKPLPSRESDESHRNVREHAEAGRAWAQALMGQSFMVGDGVDQSDETAVFWYRLAAAQGLARAQHQLSSFLADGTAHTFSCAPKISKDEVDPGTGSVLHGPGGSSISAEISVLIR